MPGGGLKFLIGSLGQASLKGQKLERGEELLHKKLQASSTCTTSSTDSRSNPALGVHAGHNCPFQPPFSPLLLHAQVHPASSPPNPLPFPKPTYQESSLLILFPQQNASPPWSPQWSPPPKPPPVLPPHPQNKVRPSSTFPPALLVTYCELSTFHTCYSWWPLSLGETVECRDLDLLSLSFQARAYYRWDLLKKKISWRSVLCGFFSLFPSTSRLTPLLSVFLCTPLSAFLSVFFCFSVCLGFSLTHTQTHAHGHSHNHYAEVSFEHLVFPQHQGDRWEGNESGMGQDWGGGRTFTSRKNLKYTTGHS